MRARLRDMQPVATTRRRYDVVVVKKWTSIVEVDEDAAASVERIRGCMKKDRQRGGIEHENFVPLPSATP